MQTLTRLADELLDLIAEVDPLNVFLDGLPGFDDSLGDLSEAAEARQAERARAIEASTRELAPVEQEERITQAVVLQQCEALQTRLRARLVEHTLADFEVSPLARLFRALPRVSPADAERERNFLTRLASVPELLAQSGHRHRAGIEAGRLAVRSRVEAAIASIDDYLAQRVPDPFLRPQLSPASDSSRAEVIADRIRPALATYREVLAKEVAPASRPDERPGLCWLPDGEATYEALARMHTTTRRTPAELHSVGQQLIAEISEEYAALGMELVGLRGISEVLVKLRSDPALRWRDGEEILAAARDALARAEDVAPRWFGRIPTAPCAVAAVPEAEAPGASAAYYVPSALDGSRPGTYYANTYEATERDRSLAETTAFHEGVPGHHFQISLAQTLSGLPQLRRVAWINAYLEGWALYAERLADEVGLFSGPVGRLGMLSNELMRAARLVVDTGLHAFGWTREQSIDYLRANTAMSEIEVVEETDRYIEMPGQALAYMTGRLEFERLRGEAETALGSAFDVRAFHDLVLGSGPVPLDALSDIVAEWTTTQAGSHGA